MCRLNDGVEEKKGVAASLRGRQKAHKAQLISLIPLAPVKSHSFFLFPRPPGFSSRSSQSFPSLPFPFTLYNPKKPHRPPSQRIHRRPIIVSYHISSASSESRSGRTTRYFSTCTSPAAKSCHGRSRHASWWHGVVWWVHAVNGVGWCRRLGRQDGYAMVHQWQGWGCEKLGTHGPFIATLQQCRAGQGSDGMGE